MKGAIRGLSVAAVATVALMVGATTAGAGTLRYTSCIQAQRNNSVAFVTANDPIVLTTGWMTSQLGNMNKFLKVQQVTWTITKSDGTQYSDDITSYGDMRYWSAPTQSNGSFSSLFNYNTGVTLAGPAAAGGPGEQATLTFSIVGQAKSKVYDDSGVVWQPDPVSGILTPTPPVAGFGPITATCTIEGR
jgi:hypothetical protein